MTQQERIKELKNPEELLQYLHEIVYIIVEKYKKTHPIYEQVRAKLNIKMQYVEPEK